MKKDKLIQTGKVLVTCTLTITGLGCHAGSGEDWADESNAMTTAEAQAFKRAASCYGLGRYLYNLAEMWVPLNEHRQPFEFPSLPQWALPKAGAPVKNHPASGPHPAAIQRGPIDQRVTGKIEGFRRILGDPIYGEILWRVARTQKANAIPNAQLQTNVAEAMERAARGIRKAHSLAESIGDTRAARQAIVSAVTRTNDSTTYWLDLGNNASSGQYVLGQPLNAANRRSAARLRTVAELYPEIVDSEAGEDPLPSCSAAEALERQEPFINQVLATSALAMLARLFHYGTLTHHGAFYNAQTGRMAALPVDPRMWERMRRRDRRANQKS
jgi:hypothetical protein